MQMVLFPNFAFHVYEVQRSFVLTVREIRPGKEKNVFDSYERCGNA